MNGLFGSKKGVEIKIQLHDEKDMSAYHLELQNGQSFDFPIVSVGNHSEMHFICRQRTISRVLSRFVVLREPAWSTQAC